MTMVIGDAKHCIVCDKDLPRCHCWVRIDFQRKPNPDIFAYANRDSFDIEFCSLECLTKFDWSKLKTHEQWLQAHHKGLT